MTADIRAYVKNTEEIVISNKKTMVYIEKSSSCKNIGIAWNDRNVENKYRIGFRI